MQNHNGPFLGKEVAFLLGDCGCGELEQGKVLFCLNESSKLNIISV